MEEKTRKKAGIGAVLCLFAVVMLGRGLWRKESVPPGTEAAGEESLETREETEIVTSEAPGEWGPVLTEEERQLLDGLSEAITQGDYENAARLMMGHEEELRSLYYEKLDGTRYLYSDGTLKEELSGKGLVLKKSDSLYWGELHNGKPEGEGCAFQVADIDGPRYDYSAGTWKDGKMEGMGIAGYHYYEGTGDENRWVQRTGMFTGDLMNGKAVYRTANAGGEVREWTMEIEEGKIVIDESWIFDEEKQAYQLILKGNPDHAYSVEKAAVNEVRFQNLIPW